VRVRRVANGILLEPMVTDIDARFAALEPTYATPPVVLIQPNNSSIRSRQRWLMSLPT
jgi:hypothetical protein